MAVRSRVLAFVCAAGLALPLLVGCAAQNPAEGAAVLGEVQFLDSFSFDRKLSASLGAGQPRVDVVFPAVITLNGIPERMDKWLSKVEKFGGKVEIQAEPEPDRGILTEIFSLFVKLYEVAEEKLIYGPAANYNVLITYKRSTGIVSRLSFIRKAPNAAMPDVAKPDAAKPDAAKSAVVGQDVPAPTGPVSGAPGAK